MARREPTAEQAIPRKSSQHRGSRPERHSEHGLRNFDRPNVANRNVVSPNPITCVLTGMRTDTGPQLNVTRPAPISATLKADSVQLASVPDPTTPPAIAGRTPPIRPRTMKMDERSPATLLTIRTTRIRIVFSWEPEWVAGSSTLPPHTGLPQTQPAHHGVRIGAWESPSRSTRV